MSTDLTSTFWIESVGWMALKISILILIPGLVQRWIESPALRRLIWLCSFAGTAGILAASLTGIDRRAAREWLPSSSRTITILQKDLPGQNPLAHSIAESADLNQSATSAGSTTSGLDTAASPSPVTWPAWAWSAGSLLMLLWIVVPRVWLILVARQNSPASRRQNCERVRTIARRLGMPTPLRVLSSPRLECPIAFGIFRPGIGLPDEFWTTHTSEAREAMLAHELAHLKARDPLALAIADVILALLWWHPLIWWARAQLRTASEAAADESSLLIENGPEVLAACLVDLAGRWNRWGMLGLLGVEGFRSGLAQRVQRLLSLREDSEKPQMSGSKSRFFILLVGSMITTIAILASPGSGEFSSLGRGFASAFLAPGPGAEQIPAAALPTDAAPTNSTDGQKDPAISRTAAQESQISTTASATDEQVRVPSQASEKPAPASPAATTSQPEPAKLPEKTNEQARAASNSIPDSKPDASAPTLHTRTYKIPATKMREGLEAVSGKKPGALPASPESESRFLMSELMELLSASGIQTNQFTNGAGGAIFYNDRAGQLFVRAEKAVLGNIEELLNALISSPPQVLIEAKFIEISSGTQLDNLFVEPAPTASSTPPQTTGTTDGKTKTISDLMSDPQFRAVLDALAKASKGSNQVQKLQGDEAGKWIKGTTSNSTVQVELSSQEPHGGILNDQQFKALLQSLEKRANTDILSAPRILTLSGRPAQIQISELRSVVTGINPAVLSNRKPSGETNTPTFATVQIPVGPTLDVVPFVTADGRSIELTTIPTLTEFLGYDKPPKTTRQRVWENGESRLVDVPLPRFRIRQLTSRSTIPNGHTLVLGGLPVQETVRHIDKVPVLGNVPLLGRLFRKEGTSTRYKTLIVFVTVHTVDPAGNAK